MLLLQALAWVLPQALLRLTVLVVTSLWVLLLAVSEAVLAAALRATDRLVACSVRCLRLRPPLLVSVLFPPSAVLPLPPALLPQVLPVRLLLPALAFPLPA